MYAFELQLYIISFYLYCYLFYFFWSSHLAYSVSLVEFAKGTMWKPNMSGGRVFYFFFPTEELRSFLIFLFLDSAKVTLHNSKVILGLTLYSLSFTRLSETHMHTYRIYV